MNMRASGASELRTFSHSKTAISFNILLVLQILCLRNIFYFRFQITSAFYMQFPFITYGMVLYINDSIPTNANIEPMYVYASERSERA